MKKSIAGIFLLAGFFAVANAAAGTLADGWDFETGSEMSRIKAWGGAKAEWSDEYAPGGKKSLKITFPVRESGVTIVPDVSDWSKFEELRFTVHNPLSEPNTKMRVMYVNGKELDRGCSISWGCVSVAPERSKTFSLKVASLNKGIDPKNINCIQFYKGDNDTVFFIDNIKLYTKAEIQEIEDNRAVRAIEAVLDRVVKAQKHHAQDPLKAELAKDAESLRKLLAKKPKELTQEEEYLLFRAGDTANLIEELAKHNTLSRPLTLIGAYPSERIFRDMALPKVAFDGKLLAAKGETESFQIVALPGTTLKDVTVSVANGKDESVLPKEWITIQPVGYVEVLSSFYFPSSRAGFWPDILVHNQPLTLANRLQPYFISVRIPREANAGIYHGAIEFTAADMIPQRYAFSIEVRNVTIPVKGELKTFFDFRYDPKDAKIRRKCYDTLFDNRLQPISMYINGKTPDTPETYAFVPHLEDLDYCISRGQNLICLWYLLNGKNADHLAFDDTFRKVLADYINYARPLMQKKGIWEMCFINGFDEIMHRDSVPKRLAEAESLCSWIKTNLGKDVKIANVGRKMKISPALMDYYFMLSIPHKEFVDIAEAGSHPCFYWVYDDPSPMLDLPGMACRILPWRTFREGAEGIAYYSTYRYWALACPPEKAPTGVDWTRDDINIECYAAKTDVARRRDGRPGDGNLFYPDRDGSILISSRIANLRDGIEDYELFAILKKLDAKNPLLVIPDSITTVKTGVYTQDQRILDARRRAIMDAIESLLSGKQK